MAEFRDFKFPRGPESRVPLLENGQARWAKDDGTLIIGGPSGNVEIANKNELGDLSTLPSWLQQNVTFAVKTMYESMTEINVKTPPYNLKGDGSDESTILQELFTLAQTNGSVYLYFPEGTYGMSGYLRLYKNTFVRMHDKATIQRLGTGYKVFVNGELSNASYVAGGGYTGEGNIHFTGGTIDLNHTTLASDKTVSAFDLGHAENLSFVNVTIKNGQIGHYFQISSCRNILFRDCWLGDVTYSNTSSNAYELIQIEVATATSFPSFGAYDLTISRDIYIENCTFDSVVRAIGNHSDGKYGTGAVIPCENIQVRGCTFKNSFDNMINLTAFRYSVFENNLIDTVAGFGIYLTVSDDNTFRNNRLLNVQKSGVYVDQSHRNQFADMTLKEVSILGTYSAIRLATSNDNVFENPRTLAAVPNYTYAFFTSGGCTGTKLRNYQFNKGKSGTISGDFNMSNNLTWCSVGDSITNGSVTYGYFQDHALPLLPNVTTHYKRGYGGYTVSIPGTPGAYNSIKDVMADVEVADIYTVFLGTNDFSRDIPVGTLADATGKVDSFWGGLKQLYIDLTTKNMNAIIVMVTPLKRTSAPTWETANAAGFKLDAYVQAIKDFASQYGLPVIDLFNESGVSNRTASTFLYDGLHPTLDTNRRIGKMIGNKINMLI